MKIKMFLFFLLVKLYINAFIIVKVNVPDPYYFFL